MKTNVLSLLAFAGALVLMSACASEEANKQEPEQKQEPGTEGLTAFVVDEGTRTTADYDGSGLNFYWTAGDDLWVNNNTALPAVVSKNSTNNIGTLLAPKPANDKKTPTAKFYFAGNFTAPSYTVRYTGKNSPSGSKVTIKAQQTQTIPNDASHIGEDGDCGTAVATKPAGGSKYNFTLDHKAAYLTFTPYNSQNAISAVHIAQIKVTADKAICGQFDFNDNGINLTSRPAPSAANRSITLTLNTTATNTGFPIHTGSAPDYTKNSAVMVLAPGTYSTFTVEYTLRDNTTQKSGTITKTYNNLTLNAGKNRRVAADLQVKDYSPWFNNIYQWDAKAPYWDGVTLPDVIQSNINYNSYGTPSANSHYNPDNSGIINAYYSCKDLPNVNEMLYYVWYGNAHYDNSTLYAYKGHLYTGGLWLKKQSVIYKYLKAAGYNQLSSQAAMKEKFCSSPSDAGTDQRPRYIGFQARVPTAGIPTPTSDYFYLPALGVFITGTLYGAGSVGDYWTSTGFRSSSTAAYDLIFQPTRVEVNLQEQRWRGILAGPFE